MQEEKKYLVLLADGESAAAEPSFIERKTAQLREERQHRDINERPAPKETSRDETPPQEPESVQDDGYPELHDSEQEAELALDDELDLDDETPDDIDEDGDDERAVDWEKRFKDTQAELTRSKEAGKEHSAELADMMAGSLQLKYDLEDHLGKAKEYTNYYSQGITNQIAQLERAFQSGQIDPDRMGEARTQYQQLVNQRNMLESRVEQIEKTRSEAETVRKRREAEITRVRLARTIPGWGQEKYREMRQEAVNRGFTADEFNDKTDHRFFEMLHDSMLLRSASQTVGDVRQSKLSKPPRGGRNVQRQPRDSRGKFERAKRELHQNPGQKGRFAAMKREQLTRERRGR